MPPDVREAVDAYAAGVNAFALSHPLPLEFRLLRYRPRPWTRVDTLAVGKLLARDLAGGWEQEVYRALYADRLPKDVQAVLYPMRFPDDRVLVGHDGAVPADSAAEETARGSNNWVVAGAHTASGKPLLANDPHLGLGVPSIWAAVHLQAPGLDVAGVTLPGAPGVVIGRNLRIAWGCTNVHDDAVDLYAEERDPRRPGFYRVGEGWERATVVDEVIRVRTSPLGSGLRDVRHPVTITRHGPLVEIHGRLWALRWPGIERSLELTAFHRLDRASNWEEFEAALATYPGPSQNFAYADVDGHIGWYSAGHLPIRATGDGSRPYRGASEEGAWSGFVPFAELPHVLDPPSGRIVTANNRLVGTDYPYVVTRGGIAPWRASAIWDRLEAREQWTADGFAEVQAERLSKPHRELANALRDAAKRHAGDAAWEAVARDLGAWDGRLEPGSREAALVAAAFRALGERAIAPRVAGLPNADRLARRVTAVQVLVRERPASFLPKGDADWDAAFLAAWQEGGRRLTAQLGADRAQWRYGATNVMAVRHLLSRAVPGHRRAARPRAARDGQRRGVAERPAGASRRPGRGPVDALHRQHGGSGRHAADELHGPVGPSREPPLRGPARAVGPRGADQAGDDGSSGRAGDRAHADAHAVESRRPVPTMRRWEHGGPFGTSTHMTLSRLACAVITLLALAPFPAAAQANDPKRVEKLLKQLKDKKGDKRIDASYELVDMKSPEAVPALAEALKDTEPLVRYNAAGALWNLKEAARPALPALQLAVRDSDGGVRVQAAGALRALQVSPVEWVAAVRAGTKDPEPDVRKAAATLLGLVVKHDLRQAAIAGDAKGVAALLDAGLSIETADNQKWTALHHAAHAGHLDVVDLLLARGAVVGAAATSGSTPLHQASAQGQLPVVQALLAKGADPRAATSDGITALHGAAQEGRTPVVELLLAKGLDIDLATKDGATPVYYAALGGQVDTVRVLVARKAQLTRQTVTHSTPLHAAAQAGSVPTIEFLLSRGLRLDAGATGLTPLHVAAAHGQLEAMKFLMSKGSPADARVAKYPGDTPLFAAAGEGQVEAMKLLIERGAKVDARGAFGRTVLHELARKSKLAPAEKEALLLVLAHKPDVNVKETYSSKTPLAMAIASENTEAADLLRQHGGQ